MSRMLRHELNRRGYRLLPDSWDLSRDTQTGIVYRSRSFAEVEESISESDIVVTAFPNHTASGHRVWFEASTAYDQKKPIIVLRYASNNEQREFRQLLQHSVWIDFQQPDQVAVSNFLHHLELISATLSISFQTIEPSPVLLVDSRKFWGDFISALSRDPILIHKIEPRRFEELIAELLEREGFEVELTQQSRDGGFDIIAYNTNALGKTMFLVECKKYAPNQTIGARIVRSFWGVVDQKKATCGAIVTTSSFTKDAREFVTPISNQLFLKDLQYVKGWLEKQPEFLRGE